MLSDAVFHLNRRDMTFIDASRAACQRLGYTREELLELGPRQICPPDDLAALAQRFDAVPAGELATAVLRTSHRLKDGRTVPVQWHAIRIYESGSERWIVVASELAVVSDPSGADIPVCLSEEGRQECLPHQAQPYGLGLPGHDPLTGLPDRRLFERRLEQALERTRGRDDYLFAVCFLDLDGFKTVNDSLGHLAGDRALCEIARRLIGCIRPGDMAARFGGDEFIVLIDNLRDASDAAIVARRILGRIAAPLEIDGHTVKLTASIGVATSLGWRKQKPGKSNPTAFSLSADILQQADRAMYCAKALGGGELALSASEPPEP